ncbi:MAG: PIN domain-containing protein [Bacteroidales bacterium]|nr:PIN domain-containing protein [Bacteroidales bacterium]
MRDTTKIYAVIDTNVIVSSLFSLDGNSFPAIVLRSVLQGHITPLYNDEIMSEYAKVLSRPKFPFKVVTPAEMAQILTDKGLI